jgi:hypothetical protein
MTGQLSASFIGVSVLLESVQYMEVRTLHCDTDFTFFNLQLFYVLIKYKFLDCI